MFIDTHEMACAILPARERSLPKVCEHYHIPFKECHEALSDAEACRRIFFKMVADGVDSSPSELESSDLQASDKPKRKHRKTAPVLGQGKLNRSTKTVDEAIAEIESMGLRGDLGSIGNFEGLTVVLSGSVPGYSNREIPAEELRHRGAEAIDGYVPKRASLLVIGHNASQDRIDDAVAKGVPVITAGELLEVMDAIDRSEVDGATATVSKFIADGIAGKSFSFASGLLTLDPFEGYQIVCEHGGIARQIRSNTSVQADTDYLVVTNDLAQGAKRAAYIDNAKSKGVEVISEDEFWDMVGIRLGPDGVADHWVLVDDYLEGGRVDVSNKPAWDGTVAPYKLFIQCRSAKSTHAGGWKVIACGFLEGTEEFKENVGAIRRLPDGTVIMDTLNKEAVPWGEWRNEIGKVVVNDRFAPKSCAYLFDGLQRCSEFDLNGLDTSGATSMRAMFRGCSSIDYFMATDRFDTSLVSDMWCMFFGCINARVINCIGWDLTQVTSMQMMFENSPAAVLFDDKNVPIPERIDTSRIFDTKPKEGRWLRRV